MKKSLLAAILATAAIAFSCSMEEKGSLQNSSVVTNPVATIADFVADGAATKTTAQFNENSVSFAFTASDVLRAYPVAPEQGDGIRFTVKNNKGTSCVFEGSGFGLMEGQEYAAYYPGGSNDVPAVTAVPVSFLGQSQPAASEWNLSDVDFLYATGIEPEGGACSFRMKHLGALLIIDVTFAEEGVYKELALTSSEGFIVKGTVDLTDDEIELSYDEEEDMAETMTLALGGDNGIEVAAGQTVTFYMMMAPDEYQADADLTLTLTDVNNNKIEKESAGFAFESGKAYKFGCVFEVPVDPSDLGTNLSANETANCYIVSEAGDYFFDATIAGNGEYVSNGYDTYYPNQTEYLAEATDVQIILNQNSCVSNVGYTQGYIYFTATGAKGNAKISAVNADGIIWTWHIWCTDAPEVIKMENYDNASKPFYIMDRNLGATMVKPEGTLSDAEFPSLVGLHYMYGFPIGYTLEEFANPVTPYSTDMKHAFQHPDHPVVANHLGSGNTILWWQWSNSHTAYSVLWGENNLPGRYSVDQLDKTLYDPCPAGYRVAPGIWGRYLAANSDLLSSDTYGIIVDNTTIAEKPLYIPFNGFLFDGYHWKSGCSGSAADERPTVAFYWTSCHNARNAAWGLRTNYNGAARNTSFAYTNSDNGDGLVSFGYGVRCVVEQ